jgi:rhodanese-related sulfurtransferase
MDGPKLSISPADLYARLGTAAAPTVIDVRRPAAFSAADRLIISATYRHPEEVDRWRHDLPTGRVVVAYCEHGHEVSRNVVATLRAVGIEAAFLAGGIAAWREAGLPTRRNIGVAAGKWVTRERPKIDRIACPWLITRFIDPHAEFVYVPASQVLSVAKQTGGTPYDIDGVEFSHEGERCSFDTILRIYQIRDGALDHLARIVRGADTSRHDLTAQCGGLFAISLGLSANFADDHEMLKHGMVMYDALYTWCRSLQDERHNWPPAKPAPGVPDAATDPTNFRNAAPMRPKQQTSANAERGAANGP